MSTSPASPATARSCRLMVKSGSSSRRRVGHVDEKELPEEALCREVQEEAGVTVEKYKLLLEKEIDGVTCSRGIGVHYWYIYSCTISGTITTNTREVKSFGWFTPNEIKKLPLEPSFAYLLKAIRII